MHVLSLPPAFVLSQDQTLKLNEFNLGIHRRTFDEDLQNPLNRPGITALSIRNPCSSLKTSTAESLSLAGTLSSAPRRQSAVHVSLSSYALVKEPETYHASHQTREPKRFDRTAKPHENHPSPTSVRPGRSLAPSSAPGQTRRSIPEAVPNEANPQSRDQGLPRPTTPLESEGRRRQRHRRPR